MSHRRAAVVGSKQRRRRISRQSFTLQPSLCRIPWTFRMAPKLPFRVKSVVYTLSPYEQSIIGNWFKTAPGKLQKKVSENWFAVGVFGALPLFGTVWWAENFKEQEKLHHRY
eukprot:jgi/Tetstr1/429034/TSEL_018999.t1